MSSPQPHRSTSCRATLGKQPNHFLIGNLYRLPGCKLTRNVFKITCLPIVHHSCWVYRNMQQLLQQLPGKLQQGGINGVLLDLGISSMQVSKQSI